MDLEKAKAVAGLQNDRDYLCSLLKDMSSTRDRTKIYHENKTTVTIPSRWLGLLIDEAKREIDDIENKIQEL